MFLFILSLILLETKACQTLTLTRSHGTDFHSENTIRGANRASLGYANTTHPWPWLWPSYGDKNEEEDNERPSFGYIIALSNTFLIMHTETADRIKSMTSRVPFIVYPTPFFYAKRHGPNYEDTYPGERVHMPFIIHTFCKYALYSFTIEPELGPGLLFRKVQGPKLEGNLSEPGRDCFAYGWSDSPFNDQYIHQNEMRYVKFRVKTERKKDGTFKVSGIDGKLCSHTLDRATPILCGPEEKLTYLASADSLNCEAVMEAFHVAPMVAEMKKLHLLGKDPVKDILVLT